MRVFQRPRLTLLTAMVLVALFALAFARVTAGRRRARLAVLVAELDRAEARVRWAERRNQRGSLAAARVAFERAKKERVRWQLEELEGPAAKR